MILPTEPIGSLPRSPDLISALQEHAADRISGAELETIQDKAVREVIGCLEAAGSALSLLYPPDGIDGYPRHAFIDDLAAGAEADIRRCLEAGAHVVQLDFTEGRLSLKLDPTGQLLSDFIALNNRVLERFDRAERARIGVHTCPGGDQDPTHSLDVDYAELLPQLFRLQAGNFYIQFASEPAPESVLGILAECARPGIRIFIGVTDPTDSRVETPEIVRDRILAAASHIPAEQLGSCDDCGFAPFADDSSTSLETAPAKVRPGGRYRARPA